MHNLTKGVIAGALIGAAFGAVAAPSRKSKRRMVQKGAGKAIKMFGSLVDSVSNII